MDISMIKQAQELKSKLEKAQKELAKQVIEAESSKGYVKVTVDGQQNILSIKISPDVMDPEKPEQLEKLLLKTIQEAMKKSQKQATKQLRGLTGGLKIPGLT